MALKYETMMKSKEFLPFEMGYLTEELIEKSKKELNETEEKRVKVMADLKELILADKKLKACMDDEYLIRFLRLRKFDLKRTFNFFKAFYRVKKDYGECYDETDYEKLESLAQSGAASFLPFRCPDGCAVGVIEIRKWDCVKNDIIDCMRMFWVLFHYASEDPATQVTGIRLLINLGGSSLQQIRSLTPRYVNLFSKCLRGVVLVRLQGLHFYNESPFFHIVWSVLKLFLTEKIKSRVHFHGDNQQDLHKFIPREILTEEYGGCNKYFNQGEWCSRTLKDYRPKEQRITSFGYID